MTISDAEGQVMEVLWRKSPLGTDEIAQALEGQQSWHADRLQIDTTLRYGKPLATLASPRLITQDGEAAHVEVTSSDGVHTFAVTFTPKLLAARVPAPRDAADARKPSVTQETGQGQHAP
jgi:Penicillinase repressor